MRDANAPLAPLGGTIINAGSVTTDAAHELAGTELEHPMQRRARARTQQRRSASAVQLGVASAARESVHDLLSAALWVRASGEPAAAGVIAPAGWCAGGSLMGKRRRVAATTMMPLISG